MSDDELPPEFERYLKRYLKRTGVFRVYRLERPRSGAKSQLLLEFVIRGRVLFQLAMWRRRNSFFNKS